jgi:carboxyl-terminal processing protease
MELIQDRYPGQLDPAELYRAAIEGLTGYLDVRPGVQLNQVLTSEQLKESQRWFDGQRDGIGVEYRISPSHGLLVTEVFAGGPADAVGLTRGDLVVGVSEVSFTGRDGRHIHQTIERQALSDELVLLVRRSETIERLSVSRGTYVMPPVLVSEGAEVPCVRIKYFGTGTANSVSEILATWDEERGVILDLRDNVGGLLEEMVASVGHFLEPGAVVVNRRSPGGETMAMVSEGDKTWNGVVVVLVNRGSRQVAEAFAAALQDHGRAQVVGTSTGGIASYMSTHAIGSDMFLRLADIDLSSPEGRNWHASGIEPDLFVDTVKLLVPGREPRLPPDVQLSAAAQLLPGGGEHRPMTEAD